MLSNLSSNYILKRIKESTDSCFGFSIGMNSKPV